MIRRLTLIGIGSVLLIALSLVAGQLPAEGARALLHPARRRDAAAAPRACENAAFAGDGVTLKGWRCKASRPRHGTLVYLHGIADSRLGGMGIVERFSMRGLDTIAYRAHGESDGDACTYGYFEKQDLHRVLDTAGPGPVVLLGVSLGAAVALQEAADDPRVAAIVAIATFSDLRTVARERAPFLFTAGIIRRAFALAEAEGHFQVDAVSPAAAATRIHVPVLLVHGTADADTPSAHSQRVLAALAGPKRLLLAQGVRHNGSLGDEIWNEIDRWIDAAVSGRPAS